MEIRYFTIEDDEGNHYVVDKLSSLTKDQALEEVDFQNFCWQTILEGMTKQLIEDTNA